MISVFAYYDHRFDDVAWLSIPSIQRYCLKHGYSLTVHRGSFGDPNRLPCFQKTDMAQALMSGTDVLFVVDVDILITNYAVRLESFLTPKASLFGCEDVNGFNAGLYMVRNTQVGRDLMEFASAYGRMAPDGHGDQNAIRKWIEFNPHEYQRAPHPAFNSYLYEEYGGKRTHEEGQWEPGDFILHLPGCTNQRRIEIMTSEAIQNAIIE